MVGLFALILAQLNYAFYEAEDFPKLLLVKMQRLHDWLFHSFDTTVLFSGLILTSVCVYGFLIIIIHIQNTYCLYHHIQS